MDIDNYIADIRANIESGNYVSEYDFQLDIQAMMIDAKDGHFIFNGDLAGLFLFNRPFNLVSVSADGIQHPHIYATGTPTIIPGLNAFELD